MGSWLWPWIGSYCIPSCISHRPLHTYQISLKSKKLVVDEWTYGRTSETVFIRSTRRSRAKKSVIRFCVTQLAICTSGFHWRLLYPRTLLIINNQLYPCLSMIQSRQVHKKITDRSVRLPSMTPTMMAMHVSSSLDVSYKVTSNFTFSTKIDSWDLQSFPYWSLWGPASLRVHYCCQLGDSRDIQPVKNHYGNSNGSFRGHAAQPKDIQPVKNHSENSNGSFRGHAAQPKVK